MSEIEEIFSKHIPGTIGRHRFYAVLVPFVEGSVKTPDPGSAAIDSPVAAASDDTSATYAKEQDNAISILYEVRAAGIMQPGEVCFPGGHIEAGESPEECAVRETCEELGLTPDSIKIFGQADTLRGPGFTLYAFTGMISPQPDPDQAAGTKSLQLDPDPTEVKEVFTIKLETLMAKEPEHYGEKMRPVIDKNFPYERVGIDEKYPWRTAEMDIPVYDIDGRIIWGLTARITESMLTVIKNGAAID